MTDYTELVKALRYTAESISRGQLEVLRANVLSDAAAAIEELLESVSMLDEQRSYWIDKAAEYYNQLPKRGEDGGAGMSYRKLGRWEKAKPKGVVMYSDGYAECSTCHEAIWLGWGMYFCPHCGVQNRIIDPDDIAKMEAQE